MKKLVIEGIATICRGSFTFDSGMPSDEPVTEAQVLRGRLRIMPNGSAEIISSKRNDNVPPEVTPIASGEGYRVKRTSRHYIIQIKVPKVESRSMTEARITEMVPSVMGEITMDRRELMENGEYDTEFND